VWSEYYSDAWSSWKSHHKCTSTPLVPAHTHLTLYRPDGPLIGSPGLEAQGDRTGSPVPRTVWGDREPGRKWRERRGWCEMGTEHVEVIRGWESKKTWTRYRGRESAELCRGRKTQMFHWPCLPWHHHWYYGRPWAQTCAEHHRRRHLLHSWLSSLVWEDQSSEQTLQPGWECMRVVFPNQDLIKFWQGAITPIHAILRAFVIMCILKTDCKWYILVTISFLIRFI